MEMLGGRDAPATGGVFRGAQFGGGDEFAQLLVAGASGDEEGQGAAVLHGEFGADDAARAVLAGGVVDAGGALQAVAIGDGERWHDQLARQSDVYEALLYLWEQSRG